MNLLWLMMGFVLVSSAKVKMLLGGPSKGCGVGVCQSWGYLGIVLPKLECASKSLGDSLTDSELEAGWAEILHP